ncbi:MAG: hypothetical protein O3C57_07045 [Verrucomicrobia bacterium]|nr:hypothetical protein [Verrucomicrobiota bacterium]
MKGLIQRLGTWAIGGWASVTRILAIVGASCALAVRPSSWPLTTRDVLARQVYFTAIEAVRPAGRSYPLW